MRFSIRYKSITDNEHDYLFKVVLIGQCGVGKSNILSQFMNYGYHSEYKETVGVDYGTKYMDIENHFVKAQMWDISGEKQCVAIKKALYRGAVGALLVYDITQQTSFQRVTHWLDELREYSNPETVTIMLVGNKLDLSETKREVTTEEGHTLAEQEGLLFMETSALDATNVESAFSALLDTIYGNERNNQVNADQPSQAGPTPGCFSLVTAKTPKRYRCWQ